MRAIRLSYVLTTFNKLSYLKEILEDLINNCKEDEEIVISDGASSDGTITFLESLLRDGKIHQFVSEKDFGEAHGFNKAILLANGELIKLISDDDIFAYRRIHECRNFLLNNPEIDIIATNGYSVRLDRFNSSKELQERISDLSHHLSDFKRHANEQRPFTFSGLGIMFRRKSISVFGLLGTQYKWVDYEFGMRITSHPKVKVAWYDAPCFIRIQNDDSNSIKYSDIIYQEAAAIDAIYLKEQKDKVQNLNSLRSILSTLRNKVRKHFRKADAPIVSNDVPSEPISIHEKFRLATVFLEMDEKKYRFHVK
jgi:glycosyltransferase involved in cell wall biosynthesis